MTSNYFKLLCSLFFVLSTEGALACSPPKCVVTLHCTGANGTPKCTPVTHCTPSNCDTIDEDLNLFSEADYSNRCSDLYASEGIEKYKGTYQALIETGSTHGLLTGATISGEKVEIPLQCQPKFSGPLSCSGRFGSSGVATVHIYQKKSADVQIAFYPQWPSLSQFTRGGGKCEHPYVPGT